MLGYIDGFTRKCSLFKISVQYFLSNKFIFVSQFDKLLFSNLSHRGTVLLVVAESPAAVL